MEHPLRKCIFWHSDIGSLTVLYPINGPGEKRVSQYLSGGGFDPENTEAELRTCEISRV